MKRPTIKYLITELQDIRKDWWLTSTGIQNADNLNYNKQTELEYVES